MTKASKNKTAFYLIAALIPVIFLILLEFGLRGIGFGQSYPLFVTSAEFSGYMQPNPNIIQRYFPTAESAPNVSPDTVYFPAHKGDDVFRIVIQGGSSAAGFPYGRFGSLQGMLEQRFKRTYPDKNIEVINTAMAAVNSYTLLDFVDEIIAIEPDVVLIYAGHNEYLGILGVGSAYASKGGRGATLLYLKLKELRLFQLLEQTYAWVQSLLAGDASERSSGRTLMTKVARGQHIPYGSPLYYKGIEQLEGNLKLISDKYKAAGVPLILGNLVSTEKDLVPFSSVGKVDWERLEANGELNELADEASRAFFQAKQAHKSGKVSGVIELYREARDLDTLRFRAPSAFNQVITQLQQEPNVYLADVETYFRQDSDDGVIGSAHMLEHVHPTQNGYFLLAEAFFDALVEPEFLGPMQKRFSREQAFADIPLSELDVRWANLKVAQLTSDYPFTESPKPLPGLNRGDAIDELIAKRAQGISWLDLQEQLIQLYQGSRQWQKAANVAGVLADAIPNSSQVFSNATRLYRQAGDIDMAIYYQNRALTLEPENVGFLLNQAHLYFLQQEYSKSLAALNKAKPLAKDKVKVRFFIDKVMAAQSQANKGA